MLDCQKWTSPCIQLHAPYSSWQDLNPLCAALCNLLPLSFPTILSVILRRSLKVTVTVVHELMCGWTTGTPRPRSRRTPRSVSDQFTAEPPTAPSIPRLTSLSSLNLQYHKLMFFSWRTGSHMHLARINIPVWSTTFTHWLIKVSYDNWSSELQRYSFQI